MKIITYLLLYVNVILLTLSASELSAKDQTQDIVKSVVTGSIAELGIFTFYQFGNTCRLSSNGEGTCKGEGKQTVTVKLGLKESDRLIAVSGFQYLLDIYLIYEAHSEESGYGAILCLDGQSLQAKWSTYIQGFNIGESLARNGFLFVTAFGFIGKIDLGTGNYVWKHDDLYRQPDYFNSFEKPSLVDNVVYFTESKPSYLRRQSVTIKVNNATGAIIEEK